MFPGDPTLRPSPVVTDGQISSLHDARTIIVRERLRLLTIAHYIYGGMSLFMLPLFIPFFAMMIFMASIPEDQWNKAGRGAQQIESASADAQPTPTSSASPPQHGQPPPKMVFVMFAWIAGVFFLGIVALSALTAYAGRCIQKRTKKALVYVVAGFDCLFVPYGTLLGVSTILVLGSPEGQAEFAAPVANP